MHSEFYPRVTDFLVKYEYNLVLSKRQGFKFKYGGDVLILDFVANQICYRPEFYSALVKNNMRNHLNEFLHLFPVCLYGATINLFSDSFYLKIEDETFFIFWDQTYTFFKRAPYLGELNRINYLPEYWAQILEQAQRNYN